MIEIHVKVSCHVVIISSFIQNDVHMYHILLHFIVNRIYLVYIQITPQKWWKDYECNVKFKSIILIDVRSIQIKTIDDAYLYMYRER